VGSVLPVYVERAAGGVVVDVDGNSFIDLGSGIAVTNVGNAAPEVVAAVRDQVAAFTHTCFMVGPYEGYLAVCEELNRLTPGDHEKRSALFNSGAEAVENAVKVARVATGRSAVVVFDHAYHGRTNLTMALTRRTCPTSTGSDRSPARCTASRCPTRTATSPGRPARRPPPARSRSSRARSGRATSPPCSSSRSRVRAASSSRARASCPRWPTGAPGSGAVFIADEIQTGFCRTGAWFASEHEQVVPGPRDHRQGHRRRAAAGRAHRPRRADGRHPHRRPRRHLRRQPVACAAALATIRTMREQDLAGAARAIEATMLPRLHALQERTGVVGDVRGRGAMLAVELVEPGTTEPDAALTNADSKACHAEGVITLTAGTNSNVLRFLPPLVIGQDLLTEALDVLDAAFDAHAPGR
jgi:4-aminobutyrate aminotransferase/(S)-3-amino-2-methylpropionate transaminase